MTAFFREIPPRFHSDVNRNLPRRRPILAAEFPPPRRHSRERGNPFLPTNPCIHLVFYKKTRENPKLNFPVKFAKLQN